MDTNDKKTIGDLTVSEFTNLFRHKIQNSAFVKSNSKVQLESEFSKLLVTRKEISQLFRVSLTTVNNWSRKKKLPKEIIQGGRVYYLRSDIENLLNCSK